MTRVFTNIPFFRILIPFVCGILIGIQFDVKPVSVFLPIIFIVTAVLLKLKKQQTDFTKKAFLICLDIFLFLLAINSVYQTNTIHNKDYYGNYYCRDSTTYFIVTIHDVPVNKGKYVKCQLKINEIKTDSGYRKVEGNLIAYFRQPSVGSDLSVGNTLLLKSRLLEVEPPYNPYEFNYKKYLYNRQVYHTTFINENSYEVLQIPLQLNTVWYSGLLMKQYVLQTLKKSKLSSNAYGICAALLTGYDDEIDKQVVDSFAHSGTLHVLSVSGLHTGLIYLVLSFLFDLVDKKRRYKLTKFLLVTFVLWSFALLTGFSAPVLRAVIMFNLLGFGKIFFRSDHRNQLNILLVSAFILLCYNPFYITDVGFLLSYFAMFGLLYFQPKLVANWHIDNYFLNWLWQGTTASFAATISTLPLTLFYFKQFPFWFFICNIIVVPASFIILMLAFLVVLKVAYAAIITNYIVNGLITFISFFNSSKFGYVDSIDFSFYDALFFSFLIITISTALNVKSFKLAAFSLILIIWWQIVSLFSSYHSKTNSFLSVYQIHKNNSVVVKNKTASTLNALDSSDFAFHVKPHVISFNNTRLAVSDFNYVTSNKQNILILNKNNYWPAAALEKINFLILANNFKLKENDLRAFPSLKTVVIDGSNNNYSIKKAEELCRKFEIQLIKTKQQGAFILNI